MSTKIPMPTEHVEVLQKHPCIARATAWNISFTPEFKRRAYDAHASGKPMKQIFIDNGFDIGIIGGKRIENFRYQLMEEVKTNPDFEDKRRSNIRKEAKSTEAQMAARIRELEHRTAYLEQENDFLKKNLRLEKEYCGKPVTEN